MQSQAPRATGMGILLMMVMILSVFVGGTSAQPHRKLLNDVVAPSALFSGAAKPLADYWRGKTITVREPPPIDPTEGSSGSLSAVIGPITIKVTWDFSNASAPKVVKVQVSVNVFGSRISMGNSTVNITQPGNVTFGVVNLVSVVVVCNPESANKTVAANVTLGSRNLSVNLVNQTGGTDASQP